ncbi:MAG TPA: hypothetical protein VKU00_18405 [Chthonomonadaceae bacterium]|nr:hypothetical protein [Chthonomonadaceae bacterium]
MKALLSIFKGPIEAIVTAWLQTRALVIPAAQKAVLAQKYGIDADKIQALAQELGAVAVSQLDSLL